MIDGEAVTGIGAVFPGIKAGNQLKAFTLRSIPQILIGSESIPLENLPESNGGMSNWVIFRKFLGDCGGSDDVLPAGESDF